MESIAFISFGIMGKPMSINLPKTGFEITVHNRTDTKTARENRTLALEAATGITVQQTRR